MRPLREQTVSEKNLPNMHIIDTSTRVVGPKCDTVFASDQITFGSIRQLSLTRFQSRCVVRRIRALDTRPGRSWRRHRGCRRRICRSCWRTGRSCGFVRSRSRSSSRLRSCRNTDVGRRHRPLLIWFSALQNQRIDRHLTTGCRRDPRQLNTVSIPFGLRHMH